MRSRGSHRPRFRTDPPRVRSCRGYGPRSNRPRGSATGRCSRLVRPAEPMVRSRRRPVRGACEGRRPRSARAGGRRTNPRRRLWDWICPRPDRTGRGAGRDRDRPGRCGRYDSHVPTGARDGRLRQWHGDCRRRYAGAIPERRIRRRLRQLRPRAVRHAVDSGRPRGVATDTGSRRSPLGRVDHSSSSATSRIVSTATSGETAIESMPASSKNSV